MATLCTLPKAQVIFLPLVKLAHQCISAEDAHNTLSRLAKGVRAQHSLMQVVFRHGARTPLESLYWPSTEWTSCPTSYPTALNLSLFDPNDSKVTPFITDITAPELPGGCRMGRLTSNGYDMAVRLGQQLRRRYVDQHGLVPGSYVPGSIAAYSTAIQRTVDTLQGVLSGLYPGAAAVLPVGVRSESR